MRVCFFCKNLFLFFLYQLQCEALVLRKIRHDLQEWQWRKENKVGTGFDMTLEIMRGHQVKEAWVMSYEAGGALGDLYSFFQKSFVALLRAVSTAVAWVPLPGRGVDSDVDYVLRQGNSWQGRRPEFSFPIASSKFCVSYFPIPESEDADDAVSVLAVVSPLHMSVCQAAVSIESDVCTTTTSSSCGSLNSLTSSSTMCSSPVAFPMYTPSGELVMFPGSC